MTTGSLIVVATPIGNLGDVSQRAIDVLKSATAIGCEDTRHTRKLLNHIGADVPTFAVHQHNEDVGAAQIVDRIQRGEVIALVSDAGTPAISDPGAHVVRRVAQAGLKVSTVPGPSAFVGALAVSGFDTRRFVFEGFLAVKGTDRQAAFRRIAQERSTSVVYEAPHRLVKFAHELAEHCGADREVCLVRELTKLHEEIWRGDVAGLVDRVALGVKGECVVVIAGAPQQEVTDEAIVEVVKVALKSGLSKKAAAEQVAGSLGIPRNRAYAIALAIKLD